MTIARRTAINVVGSLAASLAFATSAQAATSLSYYLDQSNELADGINYMQVTIADGADGAIDFTVTPLQPLLDLAGDKFEIRRFAFNFDKEVDVDKDNIVGLPDQWGARGTRRMDGFGRFDLSVSGSGPAHITSLSFSIVGVDGDTPENYVDFSRNPGDEGAAYFAARIRGLWENGPCDDKDDKCRNHPINNAFIAGSTAVPLPATAWMFLTGMAGVALRARRRKPQA